MSETGRWALPLLEAGQAQKEMTVNQALTRLDLVVQTTVEAVGVDAPPTAPAEGQAWIVGAAPTGAWTGQAGALAGWTAGGWRFASPREGMAAWSRADACSAIHTGGEWRLGQVDARTVLIDGLQVVGPRQPAIAAPAGGGVVDAAARASLATILGALRTHGLIAG